MFIDTHTHLYDEKLTEDTQQVQRAVGMGVTKMYMPNCDPATIGPMLDIADNWPDNCFPMMGLHPTYVKAGYEADLEIIKDWLTKRKFYAVGEIGLDYYWDLTFKEEQKLAFAAQIDLALAYKLPIVIHSRESNADCIAMVKKEQDGNLKGIFHCFSGSLQEAQQIIKLGLYLGIGGVVTYKKSNLPDIIKEIGLEHLVLETDAPYLSPVPYRGKRNESSYIPLIAAKIAEASGSSLEKVAEITTRNAEIIFGKP